MRTRSRLCYSGSLFALSSRGAEGSRFHHKLSMSSHSSGTTGGGVIGWISGAFGGVEQQRQPPQQQPPQAGAQKPAQKKKLSINGFWKKTPANKNVPGIAKMTRGAAYPLSRERPSKKEVNSGSYAGGDYTGSRPDDATSSSSVEPSATVSSSAPEPSRVPPTPTETKQDEEPAKPVKNVKLEKFRKWMDQQNMDMDALRKSSWSGWFFLFLHFGWCLFCFPEQFCLSSWHCVC